jgi:hypothetical protein
MEMHLMLNCLGPADYYKGSPVATINALEVEPDV